MSEEAHPVPKKHRVGCLIPLGIYLVVMVAGYFLTRPPLITGDFSPPVSRSFSVATVEDSSTGYKYGFNKLQTILDRDPELPSLSYLLPEDEITINVGDIHRASILEDHGEWQLIEFNYSNTYLATSIYRAYADRIEPVSYRVISSVGDVFVWMLITVIAITLYGVAIFFNFLRNRRMKNSPPLL